MRTLVCALSKAFGLGMEIFLRLQNRMRILFLQVAKDLKLGRRVRIVPLSKFRVGKNVAIGDGVVFDCGGAPWCDYKGGIEIGDSSYIGHNCVLLGGGEIQIGKKVLISPGTVITTQGHFIKRTDVYMKDQRTLLGKIIIEDDVWIGANSSILPGVRIGKGSVIGAGAVVNKDLPEYSVAVGIPAKVIRNRG